MATDIAERITRATRTVNEEVLDRAIRHSIFLERLKTGEVNKIIGFLNADVLPDALETLERRLRTVTARGFDLGPVTTKKLREALAATNELMTGGLRSAGDLLKSDLLDFSITEAEFQRRILQDTAGEFLAVDFATPSIPTLRSITTKRPFEGRLLRDWWRSLDQSIRTELSTQLNKGLALGESVPDLVRRVTGTSAAAFKDGAFGKLRRQVEAVVRTATNHVVTQAREMTYDTNSDVIKAVQYVATLDNRTTTICAGLDGEVFPINEGPRPPQHFQCRSTTVPVLKSWKELGINLKEPPPGTRAAKDFRNTQRQALSGKVPSQVTYGEWLKTQPREIQDEVLGPVRANLFRTGEVKINQFTDAKHRPIDLETLMRKEGLSKSDIALPSKGRGT